MSEQLTSNKQVEYAMRQLERCRSYGPDLGEYEQVIVILGDEVERMQTRITNLFSALNSKQAKIDELMLEFCPGEMSAKQRAEWAANQRAAHEPVAPSSKHATFIDKEDILNFLGELMADYVDREQLGKADLVGDAIKLITAVEPVAPSSPPADPDPEPSRADKLRAALKPAGVKVTVLGEADEPPAVHPTGDGWEENACYLLNRCPHTIRVREGGGPENLLHSFVHTFTNMEQKLELAAQPPAASQVEEVLCAGVVVSSPHDRRITLRFETDEQFRAAEVLIGIADCQVIDTAVTKPDDFATWRDRTAAEVANELPAGETEATPVECPKSPTQFHVTKIGGQVCVYCGPESEEGPL